jgi:SAM-dependent methyltransferase
VLFLKKIKNSLFTPRYSFGFHKKIYQIKSKKKRALLNKLWFLPNTLEYNYWNAVAENVGHGHENFIQMSESGTVLCKTINNYALKTDRLLDICCSTGRILNCLHDKGYKKLSGFDLNKLAIKNSIKNFKNLKNIELHHASAEFFLEKASNQEYDITYTLGATIELITPTFDIVRQISRITKKYFICLINVNGYRYPRFWEYEFTKNRFVVIKKKLLQNNQTLFVLKKEF